MASIELTAEQLAKITQDMNLQIDMLTDEEIAALAVKVNEKFNVPFLSEEKEFIVFVKIIKWIDRQLYAILPNEYYELVHDSSNGISDKEMVAIRARISPLINKVVDIPILSEGVEEMLIGFILDIILSALVKGFHLETIPVK